MKNSAVPMSAFSPKYQAQIAAQLHGSSVTARPLTLPHGAGGPMIRQNSEGLNKTEAAFQEYLRAAYPQRFVLAQSITLKLGNGVRYTPDFFIAPVIVPDLRSPAKAYEVKGFMRDDAAVKIKVAAALFPWIRFYLVRREGRTGWQINQVLP